MHLRLLSLVLTLGVALSGCKAALHPMTMPLRWTADAAEVRVFPAIGLEVLRRRPVRVEPFTDARDRRDAVGMNVEEGRNLPVTTRDEVTGFLTDRFVELLRANGVNLSPSGADRVVHTEVQRFFVTESNTYNGSVVLGITVEDAGGKQLWHGVVEGNSKRFGRSYSEENYQEALTSAALEAYKDLGEKPGFFEAFR